MKKVLAATGILLATCTSASAITLDFEGLGLADGATISQATGDIAGQLDVVYDSNLGVAGNQDMFFWSTQYSNLTNVAYGSPGLTTEIFLNPLGGASVTLNSFDLGAWPNLDRNSQYTILDGLGAVLFSSGPIVVSGAVATSVIAGFSSANGIRIQFGPDAFNGGIDNIDFTLSNVSQIPLPAALPLFAGGLGLMGLVGWRRKRKAAAA